MLPHSQDYGDHTLIDLLPFCCFVHNSEIDLQEHYRHPHCTFCTSHVFLRFVVNDNLIWSGVCGCDTLSNRYSRGFAPGVT